ncbi:FtsW/RodA/SpoVE family cell cycle protein [Sporosarcina highlanderae]|uniref:FtsW/RodA/SpoVE family cell cycle protein n=1 Tax=Sporosarcina highlanderae TaxID=3035916 RepID=A0ABT8JMF5_9BACL|nr:FtsW/RodA/SpoVE family cell cycle protein [Sporosarcina highlanderae]MDN4606338.1 FtsW/RodA/SpoVE family cell cycle protein [Sporosarcina highlanderae]
MDLQNRPSDRFDWTLAFILALLAIVGFFAIASAQTAEQYGPINFAFLQFRWYIVGMAIVAVTIYLEPEQYKKLAWPLYGMGVLLLFFLMVAPGGVGQIAEIRLGAKRWLNLPMIGRIQPSEFIKTFFILGMARLVSKHQEVHLVNTIKTDFILLGKIAITLIVPLFFIVKQPDLGTSLVFIAITMAVILVAGISWKIIVPLFTGGAVLGGSLLWMAIYAQDFMEKLGFDRYQFRRVYSWLDPYSYPSDEGYNLIQAMLAVGSGELSGKGFLGREVYIPENHTDFIFSVIGEEYGFIGASIVISLYFILIYHLTKVALELKDPFSVYVCTGVIAMIAFHVFENIGMNIQLLPITGIPLPFISYGGSSLFSNMLAIGLIFSMKFHHKTYMFDSEDE